jgi:undecaprenyl-diphosphatase
VLAILWRRPYPFLLVAATSITTSLLNALFKYAVQRDRPPTVILDPKPLMEVPTTSSFPSGHTSTSFACAYVISRLAPRLTVPVFVLAALIGFSRVYVGVHYPLDVVAGAIFGLIVARALLMLLAALQRSRRLRRAD